ncbi:hypothetical protein, partial [Cronobacter malonaticus]|uniref:hypothetical protein n=1 Tax=Cronobacter malonaticus TaxID=413503 RepID=UPI001F1E86FE
RSVRRPVSPRHQATIVTPWLDEQTRREQQFALLRERQMLEATLEGTHRSVRRPVSPRHQATIVTPWLDEQTRREQQFAL